MNYLKNIIKLDRSLSMEISIDGTIYITDSATLARRVKAKGGAVLILLNETNRGEDFSEFPYAVENFDEMDEEEKSEYLEGIYRRIKGIPWDILETKRCLLRETTVEDVDTFYELYADPVMTLYMEDLFEDPEEERQYIRDYIKNQYGFYDFGVWTVTLKESGKIIGRAGLSVRPGEEDPELGFLIGVPWQGKGYATEVCEAVIDYAVNVLDAKGVVAYVVPENLSSIRVCEKLGMERFGEMHDAHSEYIRFYRNAET